MLLRERSAILSTLIQLQFVIKTFVLSIFEWPFYTGFTVSANTGLSAIMVTSSRKSFIFYCIVKSKCKLIPKVVAAELPPLLV